MMPNEWLVEMSTSALEHADQIQRWWKAERPAAPYLFREALAAACSRLAQAPRSGAEYFRAGEPPMRRLLLHRSGYHVFYAVDETVDASPSRPYGMHAAAAVRRSCENGRR